MRLQLATMQNELNESAQREETLRQQVSASEPSTETGSLEKIAAAASDERKSTSEKAAQMLAMAMELHDKYVNRGKDEANQLVNEGHSQHDQIISEADQYAKETRATADAYSTKTRNDADNYSAVTRSEADEYSKQQRSDSEAYAAQVRQNADAYNTKTRGDADMYSRQVKDKLYADSKVIEGNIDSLKQFESDYRGRLTSFLSQLSDQINNTDNYSGGAQQDAGSSQAK